MKIWIVGYHTMSDLDYVPEAAFANKTDAEVYFIRRLPEMTTAVLEIREVYVNTAADVEQYDVDGDPLEIPGSNP